MLKEILKVFTKEYREETRYLEFKKKMLPNIKLKCESEGIDEKIKRLRELNYESNFSIKCSEIF